MLVAAEKVFAMQGGIALSNKGKTIASLKLCLCGLMSSESPDDVDRQKELLEKEALKLGLQVQAPIISLSFLSLPVIPAIRLTDKGLYDVCEGAFIESVVK
jgi:adenine deaminase